MWNCVQNDGRRSPEFFASGALAAFRLVQGLVTVHGGTRTKGRPGGL